MSKELIIGTWKLVSFTYNSKNEVFFYPYGKDAHGIIYYDERGNMATIISRKDRPLLSTSEDFIKLRDNEKIRLSKGFISYSGRYEVLEDRIIHNIEVSFIPNWIGTTPEFYYTFEDECLVLTTPETELRGTPYCGCLTWARK